MQNLRLWGTGMGRTGLNQLTSVPAMMAADTRSTSPTQHGYPRPGAQTPASPYHPLQALPVYMTGFVCRDAAREKFHADVRSKFSHVSENSGVLVMRVASRRGNTLTSQAGLELDEARARLPECNVQGRAPFNTTLS